MDKLYYRRKYGVCSSTVWIYGEKSDKFTPCTHINIKLIRNYVCLYLCFEATQTNQMRKVRAKSV